MRQLSLREVSLRRLTFEPCEDRVLLTVSQASFLASGVLDEIPSHGPVQAPLPVETLATTNTTGSAAYSFVGLAAARAEFGFTGAGQTVAIIDSGIAYDHPALGGGFGPGYRVVGGYDFTSRSSNPYDVGPAGGHGTHVAGIVGSTDPRAMGVAPGADLVALKVFDSQGNGQLSWVDQALQWVHKNRNTFAHPITTINLSLGTDWNSITVPAWGILESDFAQLKSDGIFIAVAAGNGFSKYNATGLSYPAASPYVVPVASVGTDGNLSYFSQRQDRVIAAPGQSILSTVPDYLGNLDGKTNDFATFSGTSMATPFVAGASTLIRQAYAFVGQTNVNEDTIYNLMRSTADTIHDAATNADYQRINVQKALEAIMPNDGFGHSAAQATDLGAVAQKSLAGVISTVGQHDYFSFTASQTGMVHFTATAADALAPNWELVGGGGNVTGPGGNQLSFSVVAGQRYTVGLSSSQGLGHYWLAISTEPTSWGTVDFRQIDHAAATGDQWIQVTAARSGVFTAEAIFATAQGNVSLELYGSGQKPLGSSASGSGADRIDVTANAGDVFRVHVIGVNHDVSFRLTNLVTQTGATVNVAGTAGVDAFDLQAGPNMQFHINGTSYQFAAGAVNAVNFNGSAGDTATVTGSAGNDVATLAPNQATLSGNGYTVNVKGASQITLRGGGGNDRASINDLAVGSLFQGAPTQSSLTGSGFALNVAGFAAVDVLANADATARAVLHDSAGNDTFTSSPGAAALFGNGFYLSTHGFGHVEAYSSGGNDQAQLAGAVGGNQFRCTPTESELSGAGYDDLLHNFASVVATVSGTNNSANFSDSGGNDMFSLSRGQAAEQGAGYSSLAKGFQQVLAVSSHGGQDSAQLDGGDASGHFSTSATGTTLTAPGFSGTVQGNWRTHTTGGAPATPPSNQPAGSGSGGSGAGSNSGKTNSPTAKPADTTGSNATGSGGNPTGAGGAAGSTSGTTGSAGSGTTQKLPFKLPTAGTFSLRALTALYAAVGNHHE